MLLPITSLIFALILIVSYKLSGLEMSSGYLEHPLWFGLSSRTVRVLTIVQVLGVLGYVTWIFRGDDNVLNLLLNAVFFVCQLSWPYIAAIYQKRRGNSRGVPLWLALAVCGPLWIATACLVTLFTMHRDDLISATSLGVALLPVGLLDGIVWCILALRHR